MLKKKSRIMKHPYFISGSTLTSRITHRVHWCWRVSFALEETPHRGKTHNPASSKSQRASWESWCFKRILKWVEICSFKWPKNTGGNISPGREKVYRWETTELGMRAAEVLLLMKTLPVINSLPHCPWAAVQLDGCGESEQGPWRVAAQRRKQLFLCFLHLRSSNG